VDRHRLALFLTDPDGGGHSPHVRAAVLPLNLDDDRDAPIAAVARTTSARFAQAYEQHFAFVWRNLRRLGVPGGSVDDAAQDVFLVLHRRLAELGDDAVRPWLFGVLRKVAADHRRSATRRDADALELGGAGEPVATGPGPHASLERAEAARVVHALLGHLSDEQREVFVLAELEQLGAPEIARAIGVRLNTVYSRLRAARAAFDKQAARLIARQGRGT
jgi:RNA polymerase sigma-70 factor (ECF subfamily)